MSTLASFLLSIAGSLAARVMVSVGIGVVSYAALSTLAGSVVGLVQSNYFGMGAVPLALLQLSGAGQALGIISGAIVARASLMSIKKFRPI